ncbi:ABC-2 transporter permease, partial [Klebsiella oxytoca]
FDNMSKWPRYAMIMPLSRKDLVASKFIVLLIFAVGGAIAGLVLGAGGGVLLHKLVLNTEGIVKLLQLSLIG